MKRVVQSIANRMVEDVVVMGDEKGDEKSDEKYITKSSLERVMDDISKI